MHLNTSKFLSLGCNYFIFLLTELRVNCIVDMVDVAKFVGDMSSNNESFIQTCTTERLTMTHN